MEENCTPKTTEEKANAMVEASREDFFMTVGQIRDIIDYNVSDELVRQRLREEGQENYNAAQNQLLSADAKAKNT